MNAPALAIKPATGSETNVTPIPLCDLRQQYLELKDEIDAAMQQVAAAGNYILGPNVKAFEQEMAAYCGCRYAVGVANGTDALHLALRALNIGPGDEVITTPFTFVATTEAIGLVGATPVFADIDPQTFNIDPNCVEDAITPRTRAILPVHLYGQPCDMDALVDIANRRNLLLVEDCAQSLGATFRSRHTGTFGAAGCLSFFPSKNLGCMGDGGMVITNDERVYERVEMLRRHGGKVKYHHEELGLNSRLDELQAAILRVKLPRLDLWNSQRRQHARRYNALLADFAEVTTPSELANDDMLVLAHESDNASQTSEPRSLAIQASGIKRRICAVYHQYTVLIEQRNVVAQQLSAVGIGNAIYYPVPLHLQNLHQRLGYCVGAVPHAERAAAMCLSLPMFPQLTTRQSFQVVGEIGRVFAR